MLDDSKDINNPQLEHFIREWEEVSWEREHECDTNHENIAEILHNLGFAYKRSYHRIYERPTEAEMIDVWGSPTQKKGSNYDLYKLLPTLW